MPQLISRGDLRYVFGVVHRAPDDKLTELTFEQFEELLTRVALVAFYPLSDTDVHRIGMASARHRDGISMALAWLTKGSSQGR